MRLTVKGKDGKAYEVFDDKFKPYFYLVLSNKGERNSIENISTALTTARTIKADRR